MRSQDFLAGTVHAMILSSVGVITLRWRHLMLPSNGGDI